MNRRKALDLLRFSPVILAATPMLVPVLMANSTPTPNLEIPNWHWKIGDTVVLLEPDYNDPDRPFVFEAEVLGIAQDGSKGVYVNEPERVLPGEVYISIKKVYSNNYKTEEFAKRYLEHKDINICSLSTIDDTQLGFLDLNKEFYKNKSFISLDEVFENNPYTNQYFKSIKIVDSNA